MSETIAKSGSLEFKQDEAGRNYWHDLDDNKRISEEEALRGFGDFSRARQEVEAKWDNAGIEETIVINGLIGELEGVKYYRAQGIESGIPESQITWQPEKIVISDPESQQLRELVESLQGLVAGFDQRFEEQRHFQEEVIQNLKEDHVLEMDELRQDYNQQIERLKQERETEIENLKKDQKEQIDKLRLDLQRGEKPTDFVGGEEVRVVVNGRVAIGYIASDEAEWDETRRAWVYEVAVAGSIIKATDHELRAWQSLNLPPTGELEIEDVSNDTWRSRWAKISGRIGNFATLRDPSRRALAAIQSRGAERAYRVSDEEYYTKEDVQRGNRRLGGIALFGLGMFTWWLIDQLEDHGERRYGIPKANIARTVTESGSIPIGGHSHGTASVLIADHTKVSRAFVSHNLAAGSGHRHIDYFNSANGYHRTGVELPHKLGLSTDSAGRNIIIDNHNGVVISHNDLPDGIADRQGNLSRAARHLLKAKGYVLTQGKLGSHFMTEVWRR